MSLQVVQRWIDAGRLKAWKTHGVIKESSASSAELLFNEQDDAICAMGGSSGRHQVEQEAVGPVTVDLLHCNAAILEVDCVDAATP